MTQTNAQPLDILMSDEAAATIHAPGASPKRLEAFTFWSHAQLLRHHMVEAGACQSARKLREMHDQTDWAALKTRIQHLAVEITERAKAASAAPTVA